MSAAGVRAILRDYKCIRVVHDHRERWYLRMYATDRGPVILIEYGMEGAEGWDVYLPADATNSTAKTIEALRKFLGSPETAS